MTTLTLPQPRAWWRQPGRLLRLEPPEARATVLLALLVVAFLSPDIGLPAGLPAVRLEQALLALLLPSIVLYHRAHPDARRLGAVDAAFAGLGLAIALSIALAPVLVPQVGRAGRDVFQLMRPLEYWVLYRLARIAPVDDGTARRLVVALAGLGVVGGVLGLLQVVGGQGFNEAVTAIWTGPGHNLDGVIQNGRAVGTVGNANLFGLIQGWFGLVVLVTMLMGLAIARGRPWVSVPILAVVVVGLVSSQSRSATLSIGVAAIIGVVAVASGRARPRMTGAFAAAVVRAVVAVVLGVVIAVAAAIAVPHPSGWFGSRFDVASLGSDASVVERLAILRYAFVPRDAAAEHRLICDGPPAGTVQAGHEPMATGAGSAPPTAAADAAAVQAATSAARRIEQRYCATGIWPSVPEPTGLPTGGTLRLDPSGYEISVPVSAGSPDAPAYTLTSHPNLILDPSFEAPATSGGWSVSSGASLSRVPGGSYGASVGRISLPPRGHLDQYVLYTFAQDTDQSMSIQARSADGRAETVTLQLEAWLAGGDRIPAIARVDASLPADGRWIRLAATFRTPPAGRVWVMHVVVQSADPATAVSFDLDGAELHQGSTPASFPYVRDADPGTLPSTLPSFWQSPIIGVGPMSNIEFGSVDNEYALVLLRFGVVGLVAFALLFLAAGFAALGTWGRRRDGASGALALALALAILATLAYGLAAGSYYSYQAMAILWLWVGWVSVARPGGPEPVPTPASGAAR